MNQLHDCIVQAIEVVAVRERLSAIEVETLCYLLTGLDADEVADLCGLKRESLNMRLTSLRSKLRIKGKRYAITDAVLRWDEVVAREACNTIRHKLKLPTYGSSIAYRVEQSQPKSCFDIVPAVTCAGEVEGVGG